MIIFPMAGRSSRFLKEGYLRPKYELPLGDRSVFSAAVSSFSEYFGSETFRFVVRSDNGARNFVTDEILKLGLANWKIIEIDGDTRGQADTVARGISGIAGNEPITIFNIDTIRNDFLYPVVQDMGDGFLEVFHADGENWSFVVPGEGNSVARTTEKERVSDLCCNGLYHFSMAQDFVDAFNDACGDCHRQSNEIYVAPLYNFLIARGKDIKFRLIQSNQIEHCGTPSEYQQCKLDRLNRQHEPKSNGNLP